jgi:hypothetical protein
MTVGRSQRRRRTLAIVLAALGVTSLALLVQDEGDDIARTPVRLAWFFATPVDGTDAATVAASAAEVVLTGGRDLEFRRELRASGYEGRVLQYIDMPYTRGSAVPEDERFSPWDNQVAWHPRDFATLIDPQEGWFLHGPSGRRCRERIDSNGVKYVMNPGAPGWRSFFLERVRWALDNWNYDGVFLDNLWRAPFAKLVGICGGPPRELGSDTEWRNASLELLGRLRRLGSPVWANTDGPEVYGRHLDGWMFEAFAGGWGGGFQSERDTLDVLTLAENHARQGKRILLVAQGEREDVDRLRYSLAAYLLVAGPTVSFRYSSVDGAAYRTLWSYPEYELLLGTSRGPRRRVSDSVWRREFANGYVEVDLARRVARLVSTDG